MGKNSKKQVVITGIGVISPIGIGKDLFWENALAGKHGFDNIPFFNAPEEKPLIGGIIKDFVPKDYITQRKSLKVMSKDMQTAAAATKLAFDDCGISYKEVDPTRLGVCIGAGMINADIQELGYPIAHSIPFSLKNFGKEAMDKLFPLWLLKQLPNMIASHVSIMFNAQGPSNTLTHASAAGLHAVAEASFIINRGDADMVICGSADSHTHPVDILKYRLLGVLSEKEGEISDIFAPYDKRRSGFLPGEAAVVFIIESREHANARGAKPYAEITGYGSSAGVEFFDKEIEKRSYIESLSMTKAISSAGISPEEIDYVAGHGCSSVIGDVVETEAYKKVFGKKVTSIPISSPSSMTGFLGASTGCLNLATSLMAMDSSKLSPTILIQEPDIQCDLDYVPNKSRQHTVNRSLINVFDFCGQGAAMVVSKL